MIQKIKCWFGLHVLVAEENIEIGTPDGKWRKAIGCKYCFRGGDRL